MKLQDDHPVNGMICRDPPGDPLGDPPGGSSGGPWGIPGVVRNCSRGFLGLSQRGGKGVTRVVGGVML